MARDRLPPIEFETVEDGASGRSLPPDLPEKPAHRPRWLVVGALVALVVLAVVTAGTMRRLAHERDRARADAARDHEVLARGLLPPPTRLLDHAGALFSLPSSSSLVEGAIGVVITSAIAGQNYTWIVVDGRGAVPADSYLLELGRCDGDSAVPLLSGPGSPVGGASSSGGDLRLVAGPLMFGIDDAGYWAQLRHADQDLGGIRGPLAHPTWVPPGVNPCDPSIEA